MSIRSSNEYSGEQIQNELNFLRSELEDARSLANNLLWLGGIAWNCFAMLLAYDLTGSKDVIPGIVTLINFAIVFNVYNSINGKAHDRRCRHDDKNVG